MQNYLGGRDQVKLEAYYTTHSRTVQVCRSTSQHAKDSKDPCRSHCLLVELGGKGGVTWSVVDPVSPKELPGAWGIGGNGVPGSSPAPKPPQSSRHAPGPEGARPGKGWESSTFLGGARQALPRHQLPQERRTCSARAVGRRRATATSAHRLSPTPLHRDRDGDRSARLPGGI